MYLVKTEPAASSYTNIPQKTYREKIDENKEREAIREKEIKVKKKYSTGVHHQSTSHSVKPCAESSLRTSRLHTDPGQLDI